MRFWAVSGNLLQGIAAPRLRPKYTSFSVKNHANRPNGTKIPDATQGHRGFVQEVNVVLLWLAVFGEDFDFEFGHGRSPLVEWLFVAVDVFDDAVDGRDAADDEW